MNKADFIKMVSVGMGKSLYASNLTSYESNTSESGTGIAIRANYAPWECMDSLTRTAYTKANANALIDKIGRIE